jgi:antitoxin (DNA-binding transcriptional repressor) of toxin-antitoxin stability system
LLASPAQVVGDGRVQGLRIVRTRTDDTGELISGVADDHGELIETSLILRSIGYTGTALQGLPFDAARGIVPNTGEILACVERGERVLVTRDGRAIAELHPVAPPQGSTRELRVSIASQRLQRAAWYVGEASSYSNRGDAAVTNRAAVVDYRPMLQLAVPPRCERPNVW